MTKHQSQKRKGAKRGHNFSTRKKGSKNTTIQSTGPSSARTFQIVRGSFNQGDETRFGNTAGKQCTANAAISCAFFHIRNINTWRPNDIDNILIAGNELYVDSREAGNVQHPYLTVSELNLTARLRDYNIIFDIDENNAVQGRLEGGIADDDVFQELRVGLQSFFAQNFPCGVLTANERSVAVFHRHGRYYCFDPHSVDERGRYCSNGRASLMCFDSVEALHDLLIANLANRAAREDDQLSNVYTLTAISVSGHEQAAPPPPQRPAASRLPSLQRYRLADMNIICPHCQAKLFHDEVRYCCGDGKISFPPEPDYPDFIKDLLDPGRVVSSAPPPAQPTPRKRGRPKKTTDTTAQHHQRQQTVGQPSHTPAQRRSAHFKANICIVNNMFSFASMAANVVERRGIGLGDMYIVQGKICHRYGDIPLRVPPADATVPPPDPQHGYLYFLDSAVATAIRQRTHRDISPDLIDLFDRHLRAVNPYAIQYFMLRERFEREERPFELNLTLFKPDDVSRRYDLPGVAHEIGAVFRLDNQGNIARPYVLRIYPKDAAPPLQPHTLDATHPLADPLAYPVLFPYGQPGWRIDIDCNIRKGCVRSRVSMLEFYKYRIFRVLESRRYSILNFGKLTQQYIVDAWVKVEGGRLEFLRNEQHRLRANEYHGLLDYLRRVREEGENIVGAGRTLILPSTFVGGPRAMQQHFQDAMAVVARFGKPDLFITFTCNPRWPEILQYVKGWEKEHDRVDLICRVFRQKLKVFMSDVTKRKIFGKVLAYVYVVEFQKRGLPHCHLLLTLDYDSKLREAHQIDAIISAEIPDETMEPELFESVTRQMLHNRCGTSNQEAPCMKDGKCTKGFPKPFEQATTISDGGFPRYRRRDNSTEPIEIVNAYGQVRLIDNAMVVPYSPFLVKKFNCHINVEVCSSLSSVKYIFKYVYKGHDSALLHITSETGVYDEIDQYEDMRYVSSCEATWRLLKYPLHGISHIVTRLHFHEQGRKYVNYHEGNEEAAVRRAATTDSMFEAWFTLNRADPEARRYLYPEIPLYYTYSREDHRWKRGITVAAASDEYQELMLLDEHEDEDEDGSQRNARSNAPRRPKVIPRLYSIMPDRNSELFYLRILLLHVRGARSYEELRTIDGTVYPTYKTAAWAMGLLREDTEWENCLREAANFRMPRQLRRLFAYILVCCAPQDARGLWDTFKFHFSEDFIRRGYDVHSAETRALHLIHILIQRAGGRPEDFPLPPVDPIVAPHLQLMEDGDAVVDDRDDMREGGLVNSQGVQLLNLITEDAVLANRARFSTEQREVYDNVMGAINQSRGGEGSLARRTDHHLFFLDGPGGTGKTFLYNAILDELHLRRIPFVAVAWTGIAAILLRGGRTVHSRFRLPLNVDAKCSSSLTMESAEAQELREAEIIVWDEITMANVHAFDAVDRLFRDVMRDARPFGGKVVLLGGDFRQCLPVIARATKTAIMERCIVNSNVWGRFEHRRLTRNMRTERRETEFAGWLLKLGDGRLTGHFDHLESCETVPIPKRCIVHNVVEAIYGDLDAYATDGDNGELRNRVILSPRNDNCDRLNERILAKFPGEATTYYSADEIDGCTDEQELANFTTEYLNSLTPSGMPPHRLTLKRGVPIILMRNICIADGLCNGTRLKVRGLHSSVIEAEISMGQHRGQRVLIPRMDMRSDTTTLPFPLKRRQFPVRLCFAMTINKAQGQTFDRIGIYLPDPVFAHGQLYVAFSRVRSWDSVKVELLHGTKQGKLVKNSNTVYTRNVVYRTLLDRVYPPPTDQQPD